MKIEKLTLLFCIVIILGIGWKTFTYFNPDFEKCFAENNENFKEKTQDLNVVIKEINQLKLKERDHIPITEFPEDLKTKLEKLGVGSVNYFKTTENNCSKEYTIELNIGEDWNIETLNNVKIIYSPCDENTKLNYHTFDGYHIDSWGQGNNWLILSDTDFI